MNTKEIATEYRMAQWTQIMQERSASGESISKFCENRGIRRNRYFYWQRKLRESACKELLPAIKHAESIKESKAAIPKGWALCEPSEPESETGTVVIEIGKFRVNANADASAEHIAKVCQALMSLC